jgi:flagellar biosynthesis protein FlhA
MTNNEKSPGFIGIGYLAAILLLVVLIVSLIPAWLLDILIVLNLFFALHILLTALYSEKPVDFSAFSTTLIFSTLFSIAVTIASTRLILTKGENFNGQLIRLISDLTASHGNEVLILSLCIFGLLSIMHFDFIFSVKKSAAKASAFALDFFAKKQGLIDSEYGNGTITREECTAKKDELQKETDFYGKIEGVLAYITGIEIFIFFFFFFTIIAGTLNSVNIHGQITDDAIEISIPVEALVNLVKTYLPLSMGNGFFLLLPPLFHSLAVRRLIKPIRGLGNEQ